MGQSGLFVGLHIVPLLYRVWHLINPRSHLYQQCCQLFLPRLALAITRWCTPYRIHGTERQCKPKCRAAAWLSPKVTVTMVVTTRGTLLKQLPRNRDIEIIIEK